MADVHWLFVTKTCHNTKKKVYARFYNPSTYLHMNSVCCYMPHSSKDAIVAGYSIIAPFEVFYVKLRFTVSRTFFTIVKL